MTTCITDTFDRADSATTLGNTDTGETWTPQNGTFGIDTNKAKVVSTAGGPDPNGATYIATVPFVPDCDVSAKVSLDNVDGHNAGLIFRYKDSGNWLRFQAGRDHASAFLQKRVGGADIASVQVASVSFSDGATFRVVADGPLIHCYVDGVLVIAATLTDLVSETLVGINANVGNTATNSARWNDFSACPLTGWEIGIPI